MSAKDKYEKRSKEINESIKQIQYLLRNHKENFVKSHEDDWGFEGDLAHISSLLNDCVVFLESTE